MSDSNDQRSREVTPPGGSVPGEAETQSKPQQSKQHAPGSPEFLADLKRNLELTRLRPEETDRILAEMPPMEEQEKLLREMIEHGGLSSEEFLASLGLDVEPQP